MPLAAGVHVWVEVEGTPLQEHQIEVEGHRVTCHIPSQEGKKFSIRFRHAHAGSMVALRGNIFLDGIASGAGLLLATDMHACMISGQTRWEGLESPFQFARLKTTDDESEACQDEARLRELGTIRVQIEWVNVVRQEEWRQPSTSTLANQPIHERSKKASAHCTSLGELEISRPKHWYSTTKIPYIEPLDFVFQYAPVDWLRARGIFSAPALVPASPTASSNSRPGKRRQHDSKMDNSSAEETLTEVLDEEEAAIYQRLKAKMANRKHAKRLKTVKQEPDTGPRKRLAHPPEVIDLTGED
ncbi:hypothetical protein K439DRAFT_1065583 [Ramaria rubella]|nr:hypothetical protein K439DRAFT_1065583 [Ramaria rubella]